MVSICLGLNFVQKKNSIINEVTVLLCKQQLDYLALKKKVWSDNQCRIPFFFFGMLFP